MNKKKTTTDAVEILHRRFVENDPEMQEALNEVAQIIGLPKPSWSCARDSACHKKGLPNLSE